MSRKHTTGGLSATPVRSELYVELLLTALPIAGQNLLAFASSFIDSLMVSPLGADAVGAVYAAGELQRLLRYITIGIEGGVLIAGSAALGRGERSVALRIGIWGIITATVLSLCTAIAGLILPNEILSLFSSDERIVGLGAEYLRIAAISFPLFCIAETVVAADRCLGGRGAGPVSSLVGLLVSLTLNAILINGGLGAPALGARGAAISAVCSRFAQLISLPVFFLIRRRVKSGSTGKKPMVSHPRSRVTDAKDRGASSVSALGAFARTTIPTASAQLLWGLYMLLSAAVMTGLDTDGSAASTGIAAAAYNLAMASTAGYTSALSMMAGYRYGRGDLRGISELRRASTRLSLIFGIVSSALTLLLARPLISLYGISGATEELAGVMLLLLCAILPFSCYESPMLYGLLRGAGRARLVLFTDLIVLFGIVLPAGLLAAELGAYVPLVYAILRSEAVIKTAVAAVATRRLVPPRRLSPEAGPSRTPS